MPPGTEKKVTRRVGGVRPSQLMYAFGIGSVVDLLGGAYSDGLIFFAMDDQQRRAALFEPSHSCTHGSPQIGHGAEARPFDVGVIGKQHGGYGPGRGAADEQFGWINVVLDGIRQDPLGCAMGILDGGQYRPGVDILRRARRIIGHKPVID